MKAEEDQERQANELAKTCPNHRLVQQSTETIWKHPSGYGEPQSQTYTFICRGGCGAKIVYHCGYEVKEQNIRRK